jgi:hypothetical protein
VTCIGWNLDKLAVWKLTVHGNGLPGRWVIIDREFRPAQQNGRRLEDEGRPAMGQGAAVYYANLTVNGPVEYRRVIGSIAVLEAPDNHSSIGVAKCTTCDDNGLAVFVLTVRGHELPGRWVIIDREFRAAQ